MRTYPGRRHYRERMTVARYLFAAGAAAAMVAGGLGAAAASPEDSSAGEVVLTTADNGRAVAIAPGGTVIVRLAGMVDHAQVWAWSPPATSAPRVLARIAGTTAPGGDAVAVFRGGAPGAAQITSYRRCVSTPGVMCSRIAIPWKVTVSVEVGLREK
jgi:hypothetical protein